MNTSFGTGTLGLILSPKDGRYLQTLAGSAETALEALGYPIACVCGVTDEYGACLRIHALGYVPVSALRIVSSALDRVLSATISCQVTSWTTHPRAFFSVSLDPLPSGAWSNFLPSSPAAAPVGEACGQCGTRAVTARRCSFCGARA